MKLAFAALSLAAAALAQTPGTSLSLPRCFPDAFITKSFVIDPINNFFDETAIYFDKTSQRQRVDIKFNNPNERPLELKIYLFPSQGVSYAYTPAEQTCIRREYTIRLDPLCRDWSQGVVNPNVRVGRQTVLSGDVATQLTNDTYWVYPNGQWMIPLAVFSRSKTSPSTLSAFLQYYDYSFGPIDSSHFNLPTVCTVAASSAVAPRSKETSARMDAAEERINRITRSLFTSGEQQ